MRHTCMYQPFKIANFPMKMWSSQFKNMKLVVQENRPIKGSDLKFRLKLVFQAAQPLLNGP